jgi:hypothetical protein
MLYISIKVQPLYELAWLDSKYIAKPKIMACQNHGVPNIECESLVFTWFGDKNMATNVFSFCSKKFIDACHDFVKTHWMSSCINLYLQEACKDALDELLYRVVAW